MKQRNERFIVEAYSVEVGSYMSRILQGRFTHCVKDTGADMMNRYDAIPYQGTEAECIADAERRNTAWAMQLMTQGTKAEGL